MGWKYDYALDDEIAIEMAEWYGARHCFLASEFFKDAKALFKLWQEASTPEENDRLSMQYEGCMTRYRKHSASAQFWHEVCLSHGGMPF